MVAEQAGQGRGFQALLSARWIVAALDPRVPRTPIYTTGATGATGITGITGITGTTGTTGPIADIRNEIDAVAAF